MATVPKTVKTYALDGTKKDFSIPFEYLARKFVTVTLIGTTRKELVLITDYRFTTSTQITTNKAWGPGDGYEMIEIRRLTSATERLVDFADGSILRAYDLNISQVQSLHIAEEARDLTADTIGVNNDGNLDARARRIVNLADGVDPGDAVSYRQMQSWSGSALNSANSAAASASSASASATSATASKNAAATSASAALASQNAAKTSETAAAGSSTSAAAANTSAQAWASKAEDSVVSGGLYSSYHYSRKSAASADASLVSQNAAKASETAAAGYAANLGNNNAFVNTLESVSASSVVWKPQVIPQARGYYAFDPADSSANVCLFDVNGMYRQGALRFYSSTGQVSMQAAGGQWVAIGKTAAELQSEGNIDINLKGPINTTVFRLISPRPIMHFRTSSAIQGLIATSPKVFQISVYDGAGANGASMLLTQQSAGVADLSVPGDVSANSLTADRMSLSAGSVAAVGGNAVMVAKSSPWINFVASGSTPSGKNRMAHNLGREALGFQLQYRCTVADAGYSVGDIVTPVDMNYQSSTSTTRGGQLVRVDNNNVDYFCGGTGVVLINKTTGVATTMTIASWECRVTAFGIANG